jgi:hypothetical protein
MQGAQPETAHFHRGGILGSAVASLTPSMNPDTPACEALASRESVQDGNITSDPDLVSTVENAPNPLGADAWDWISGLGDGASDTGQMAGNVVKDCQQAGVPDVLGGGS